MEYVNNIEDYPKSISLEGTEIILEQMKNTLCIINIGNKKGIGFFCKIPFLDNNNNLLIILINNKKKEIELKNRIKYTNKKYDITIIEIKDKDKINNYLELDNHKRNDKSYKGESIYILNYSKNKKIRVSYGIIKEENKNEFICNIDKDSSGVQY